MRINAARVQTVASVMVLRKATIPATNSSANLVPCLIQLVNAFHGHFVFGVLAHAVGLRLVLFLLVHAAGGAGGVRFAALQDLRLLLVLLKHGEELGF